MTGILLVLVGFLADALAPESVRVAAAKSDNHTGVYVAIVAALAAVATSVAVLKRRKKRG